MAVIAVRPLVLVRLPPGSCRERLRRWVAAHTPFVLNERGPKLTPANSRMASVAAMPLALTRRLPPGAHPHFARRRSRRRTTGGGCPGADSGRGMRVMPPSPASRKYRPAHLRHGRAGCASASRRSGRSPTFQDARSLRPPRTPIRPAAVAATDTARRESRYHTQRTHPEVIARHHLATGVQAARRRPDEVAARQRS